MPTLVHMQPEELSEGDLTDINESSGCDEKDDDVPGVVLLAKPLTFKDLLKIFRDIKSSKGKMLEVDVTFQRSMSIHQEWEKMPSPYYKLHSEKPGIVQTTLKFLQWNKTLILDVSSVFSYSVVGKYFIMFSIFLYI